MVGKYFGTDGIRGRANGVITPDLAFRRVVIGKDKRAGVSLPTIQRFESVDGVPPSRSSTLLEVKAVLA
jgi:hypothetical protein